MRAICPNCGCTLEYNASVAGDVVACPECQGRMQLPVPVAKAVETKPAIPPPPATPEQQKELARDRTLARFCPSCGAITVNEGTWQGSNDVEVILGLVSVLLAAFMSWYALIIPVVYAIWRRSKRIYPCLKCGGPHTIPVDSDEARARGIRIEEYTLSS